MFLKEEKNGFVISLNSHTPKELLVLALEAAPMFNNAAGFNRIFIACEYTDLRRGIDGFAAAIFEKKYVDYCPCTRAFCIGKKNWQLYYLW